MKLYLDGQKFNSKEELHSFLADKLNFPSYYGNNLDALYDCLTDITYPLLLVASHIVPWADNKDERLNPANGICLSALYDRAFDKGLIAIDPNDYTVMLSKELLEHSDSECFNVHFGSIERKTIIKPIEPIEREPYCPSGYRIQFGPSGTPTACVAMMACNDGSLGNGVIAGIDTTGHGVGSNPQYQHTSANVYDTPCTVPLQYK